MAERRHKSARLLILLLVLTCAGVGGCLTATSVARGSHPSDKVRDARPSAVRSLPANDAPANAPLVFAHYFPPFPISIDNAPPTRDYYATEYLNPAGEGGRYAAVGGLLRDRPLGRAPLKTADWKLQDLRTEVRQAKSAGIDGFSVDILNIDGPNWTACLNLMRAAQEVSGFSVVPMVDATSAMASYSPTVVAAKLAELYAYSSAQAIEGDYVLSGFAAESKAPSWWREILSGLKGSYGFKIKFIAVFLDASRANMTAFAPISYGFGNWGGRTVDSIARAPDYAAIAHSLDRTWMEPVAFQDVRPRDGLYAEASNTETGRAAWLKAQTNGADYVQLVTWNDYSETTAIAPSVAHGKVLLDICAYFLAEFKTSRPPVLTTDHLYLTHRIHPYAAAADPAMSYTLGGMQTPPRDTVEALVFLTRPATVSITTSAGTRSFDRPAGVNAVTAPLAPGRVSATLTRGSRMIARVVSTHVVRYSGGPSDFQYYAVGR